MSLLHGFDVSAYQGNTVPVADFVMVKATEGASYSSSRFAAQWKSAATRAKIRGAYHFARPEQSSGSSQADRLIAAAKAVPGEVLVLDLEASKLNQAATNKWAREFGDRLRARAPGVTTIVYMGSAYAANGTGRDLADHFDLWWYPQYPSSAATTKWPSSVSPWLPGNLTCGWKRPHIWQWTSSFNGLDANITDLTLDQLAGPGDAPIPNSTEVDVYGGTPPLKVGERRTYTCPKGSINIWGIAYDSPGTLTYRIAAHSKGGGGEVGELTAGGPNTPKDAWPVKPTWTTKVKDVDWFSIELVAGDPTVPDANGKVVTPGWDASHTA